MLELNNVAHLTVDQKKQLIQDEVKEELKRLIFKYEGNAIPRDEFDESIEFLQDKINSFGVDASISTDYSGFFIEVNSYESNNHEC
jgi:hypothetical protein